MVLGIGIALSIFAVLSMLTERLYTELFMLIGSVILTAAVVGGFSISFSAMFKYNRGIF